MDGGQQRPWLLSVLSATLIFTSIVTSQQCYAPNGTAVEYSSVSSGARLYACPAGADGYATCCADGDFCHPDGLCYNLNFGQPTVRRQYCTDSTWKTANCSPLCRHDEDDNSPSNGGAILTPCTDGKFCCGALQSDCCDDHAGEYAIKGYQVGAGINYVSSTSTTQTTSDTSPATSPATPVATDLANAATSLSPSVTHATDCSPAKNSSINGGTIAGIVVGGSVGFGMMCIAAALFFRRRKPATLPPQENLPEKNWNAKYPLPNYGHLMYGGYPHSELSSSTHPGELPTIHQPHEMDASWVGK